MKSRTLLRAFFAGILVATAILSSHGFGQVRFREFREDRALFEKYAERAKSAKNEAEFESLLRGAHAFFSAQWERDAEQKIADALRREGEGANGELSEKKSVARAEWEREVEAEAAKVRGAWYARHEAILRVDFDAARLAAALGEADAAAKDFAGKEKLSAWDLAIAPKTAEISARWEEKLSDALTSIRARGDAFDAETKAHFEKEIRAIERELRTKFRLETSNLIYKRRNNIIRDELLDRKSLRTAAERGKASAIADEILARTVDALQKRKDALLANPEATDGAPTAAFSDRGCDWERRLRELVESGLSVWRSAQEEFLSKMASWKKGAEDAYRAGDDEWRKAYEKLALARESWQKELEQEINKGIEQWQKRDQELAKELERAKEDLNSYLSTTDASWQEYSKGAYEMLMQGASIHGEALGQIEWLKEMVDRYGNRGSLETIGKIEVFFDPEWFQNFNENVRRGQLLIKKLREQGLWNEAWYTASGKLLSSRYDAERDCLVENYEVTVYQLGGYGWLFLPTPVGTFNWVYTISDDSPEEEKSIAFMYTRELHRWQKMRDEFSSLLGDAEKAVHDAAMLGDGGPGFLRNIYGGYGLNPEGESDPYLMTQAEFEYELARREKEYLAKRLEIAKAVLDYATAEGPREGAEATVEQKEKAEQLRKDAREYYEARLAEVKALTDEMARIKGIATDAGSYEESIAYLSAELEMKKGALLAAEEEYKRYSEALVVLENGENIEYLTRQMYLAQSEYLAAERDYWNKRTEYFDKLRAAEGIDRAAGYMELAAEEVHRYVDATRAFDAFSGIVNGEIDNEALKSWGELLFSDDNAFLWEGKEARYGALQEAYEGFVLSPGDEDAKAAFVAALHGEYRARTREYAVSKLAAEALLDERFDPAAYVKTYDLENEKKLHEIKNQYRPLQQQAFEAILEAMNDAGEQSYAAVMSALSDMPDFAFGEENDEFLVAYAAHWWAAEYLADVTPDTWESRKADIQQRASAELQDDFFALFDQFKGRWDAAFAARSRLKELCMEHESLFAYSDELARAADFESALVQNVEEAFGGRVTFSDLFEGWSFDDFKIAAERAAAYTEKALSENKPVPLGMKTISQELESVARELAELLYVQQHASDNDFRDVYAQREELLTCYEAAYQIGENAVEIFSHFANGSISAATLLSKMIADYDGLHESAKAVLAESTISAVGEYISFLDGARELVRTASLFSDVRSFLETGGSIGVEGFLATVLGDEGYKNVLGSLIREHCFDGEGNFLTGSDYLAAYAGVMEAIASAESLIAAEARNVDPIARNYAIGIGEMLSRVRQEAAMAKRLVEYHDNPASFSSARNYLVNMVKNSGNGGSPGAEFTLSIIDWKTPWVGGIIDVRDGEGAITTAYYEAADGEGRMLGSMLIDAANRAALLLKELRKAARPDDENDLPTSETYRLRMKAALESRDMAEIDSNLSEARTLRFARGISSLANIEGEIQMLSGAFSSRSLRLSELSKMAGAIAEAGGSKETLRLKWQEAATVRNAKQKEYSELSEKLATREKDYRAATNAYLAKMNETAKAYAEFKDAQHAYEKAYAVWEYAHTPYLIDTIAKTGTSGEGELPGGGTEALAVLNPADARERYRRAKEAFEAAEEVFLAKKAAMEAQERVEDLSSDERYRRLREEFKTEAESHARFDRAATLLDEETKKLAMEAEFWEKSYKAAKEDTSGFVKFHYETDADGNKTKKLDAMSEEELSKRDMILGRLADYITRYGEDWLLGQLLEENGRYVAIISYETEYVDVYDYVCDACPPIRMLKKDHDPAGYQAAIAAYRSIDAQLRSDMEYLRAHNMNYELIADMAEKWRSYKRWERKRDEARNKLKSIKTITIPYFYKKKWKEELTKREEKMKEYQQKYEGAHKTVFEYLRTVTHARNNLADKRAKLAALDRVRSVAEFRNTTFARDYLALTESDRYRIYDSSDAVKSDINISALRRKLIRKDIDGRDVQVRREGEYIRVLDREGKVIESYSITDPSILIAAQAGTDGAFSASQLADGAQGYLVDYVYSAREVSAMIAETSGRLRTEKKAHLEEYAAESVHERTIVLRDLEALYASLMSEAAKVGGSFETRPRRYAGYGLAVNDFLAGEGNVSARVVKSLIDQKAAFQKQDWDFTIKTYQEKKKQWMEAVTFISARGTRDWAEGLYAVENAWRRWRLETRAAIAEGEEKWEAARSELEAKQKHWAAESAHASADAAAAMMGKDIEAEIRAMVGAINAKLPGNVAVSIDAEKIYADAMKSMPKADLGALSQSMTAASTTFGISEVLNLGLTSTMYDAFKSKLQEFESGMKVVKNLRMGEVVLSMMKSFEEQLTEANKANYDMVLTGLAANIPAPFERDTKAKQWRIRVVTDHSLVSTTYRTRTFEDYKNFVNTTVKLKDIRTLSGGAINFSDPATYNSIDAEELEMYVSLETDHLKREIARVFENGEQGLFGAYSKTEFDRLQERFQTYYAEYMEGEALMGMGWYRTPIVPNGPDPMTAAKIGSAFAGPWAAFAVNAALLAVDVKDGVVAGKHALVQAGVGFAASMAGGAGFLVNMGASGIDYEDGGGIGWSNKKFREGATRALMSYALSNTLNGALNSVGGSGFTDTAFGAGISAGISGFAMSGLTISSSGWGSMSFGFDMSNWREHVTVGLASGISAAVSKSMSGGSQTGSEKATHPGGSMLPEQWGDQFIQKAISGGLNSLIMTAGYHAFGGKGFANDYSKMNWNNMTFSAYDLGSFLGSEANSFFKERQGYDAKTKQYDETKKHSSGWFEDLVGGAIKWADAGEKVVKGFFEDIGEIAGTWMTGLGYLALEGLDAVWSGVKGIWNGAVEYVKNFGQSVGNLFSVGWFASDDTIQRETGMIYEEYREYLNYRDAMKNEGTDVYVMTGKLDITDAGRYGSLDYFYAKEILGYYEEGSGAKLDVVRDNKGNVIGVEETYNNGFNKDIHIYKDGERIGEMNQYYSNKNGKLVRDYQDVYMFDGDNIHVATQFFDSSGLGVFESTVYTLDKSTDTYVFQYQDKYFMDENGLVTPDYKQFDPRWGEKELYNGGPMDFDKVLRYDQNGIPYEDIVPHNRLAREGCVVSTWANITGMTPAEVDDFLDKNGGYLGYPNDISEGAKDWMNVRKFVFDKLGGQVGSEDKNIQEILDQNVSKGIRTEIRFNNHSTTLSGARYDVDGNVTHYLINDPARWFNMPIDRKSLQNPIWGKVNWVRWAK